jgi:hypothetical protein
MVLECCADDFWVAAATDLSGTKRIKSIKTVLAYMDDKTPKFCHPFVFLVFPAVL